MNRQQFNRLTAFTLAALLLESYIKAATPKSHLRNACSLQAECLEMALTDTDLVPLHPWISAGLPLD